MSNGVPEPFEEDSVRPLKLGARAAALYVVLWVTVALVSLLFDLPLITGHRGWLFALSIVLLALSIGSLWRKRPPTGAFTEAGEAPSEDQIGTPLERDPPGWAKTGCAILALVLLGWLALLVARTVF